MESASSRLSTTPSDIAAWLAALTPFSLLTAAECAQAAAAITARSFPPQTVLLSPIQTADHLILIANGRVQTYDEEELVGVYGPQEAVDFWALFADNRRSRHTFRVHEALDAYLLPFATLDALCHQNFAFHRGCVQTATARVAELSRPQRSADDAAFAMAKVGDAYYRPPIFIDATASIHDAVALMKAHKISSLLVKKSLPDKQLVGVVSDSDVREHVVLQRKSVDSPIGELATYQLVGLQKQDFLFNAKIAMNRHGVKRLVVFDRGEIDGILDQIDLFSYFSDHSRLIAVQAARATTVDELQRASQGLMTMVRGLADKGIQVRHLAEMVTDLNRKIFQKLFELIVPPKLAANACFIVMGSEGRAEQILKTDQDNAMILRDGYDHPRLEDIANKLTETLIAFGYPPCDGNIMVSNPFWCQSFQNFKRNIDRWIDDGTEEDLMNLAIFYDAASVAGDENLLRAAKGFLFNRLQDHPGFYARFARPTLAFPTPLGFFETFSVEKSGAHKNQLDIKKGGIFPIVQGVRSLALEARLDETNTLERIQTLEKLGKLDKDLAAELSAAYSYLSSLRLLSELRQFAQEGHYDNYVMPSQFNKVERDGLRDALKTVNSFKKLITHHFRLNMLG